MQGLCKKITDMSETLILPGGGNIVKPLPHLEQNEKL
jgi:hypothetical protein